MLLFNKTSKNVISNKVRNLTDSMGYKDFSLRFSYEQSAFALPLRTLVKR